MSEDHEREYARIRANIDVLSRDVLSASQMIMDWLKAAIMDAIPAERTPCMATGDVYSNSRNAILCAANSIRKLPKPPN